MTISKNTPRLEIQTRLHEGITGGGEWETHRVFTVGPRNAAAVTKALEVHKEKMERCYGNIGCGHSTIVLVDEFGEIDVTVALTQNYSGQEFATAAEIRQAAVDKEAEWAEYERRREIERAEWDADASYLPH